MNERKKVLIIKPSSFGDIIQANPTLTALKKQFPGYSYSWLVFERWADIPAFFSGLDRVITWDRDGGLREYLRVAKRIRAERFDIVIDLQGLMRTAVLAFFSGAKEKIGVPGMKELSWLLVTEVFRESRGLNAVMRSLECARHLTGKRNVPEFSLALPPESGREAAEVLSARGVTSSEPVIGIVPSVRGPAKQWPLEYYRELADMVASAFPSMRILVLGGESERGLIRNDRTVDLCGETSLVQLGALLKRCRAVIGGDTGPVHFAAALGVPVAVIFGGSDVNETAPVTAAAAVLRKDFPCSPCRGRVRCADYPCLRAIKADEVFKAIASWIIE